jgi:hypothetical protein
MSAFCSEKADAVAQTDSGRSSSNDCYLAGLDLGKKVFDQSYLGVAEVARLDPKSAVTINGLQGV